MSKLDKLRKLIAILKWLKSLKPSAPEPPAPEPEPPIPEPTPPSGSDLYPGYAAYFWPGGITHTSKIDNGPFPLAAKSVCMMASGRSDVHVNYRTIFAATGKWNPNSNPGVHENQTEWRRLCRLALAERRISGICVDNEMWMVGTPDLIRVVADECHKAGKLCLVAPKAGLNNEQKYWRRNYEQVVRVYAECTDGAVPWDYNLKTDDWLRLIDQWCAAGYRAQIFPCGDGGSRPWKFNLTAADGLHTVKTLAVRGISYCLFQPQHCGRTVLNQLVESYQ